MHCRKIAEIAPLFAEAKTLENVVLPIEFMESIA